MRERRAIPGVDTEPAALGVELYWTAVPCGLYGHDESFPDTKKLREEGAAHLRDIRDGVATSTRPAKTCIECGKKHCSIKCGATTKTARERSAEASASAGESNKKKKREERKKERREERKKERRPATDGTIPHCLAQL